MVQCPHCGQENPPQYRFCGMCGKAVVAATPAPPKQAVPVSPAPVASALPTVKEPVPPMRTASREVAKTEDVPFTGPSFLGLSSGSSESSAEYLLEEEAASSGRGKMVVALLLLLVAAGLLGWKWHFGNYPWQSASNAPATTTTQSNTPAAVNTPASTPGAAPQNPTDAANTQNQAAAPQNAAPSPTQPADNAATPTTDSSAANGGNDAGKAAQPAASDAGQTSPEQPSSAQSSDQSSDNQATEKPAAPAKPAPVKQAAAAPKVAPRRVAVADDDSPESEAQALLTQGERYLNGNGVPQNCGRAQDSLRSAADRGSLQAINDLATMYSTGHCVKKDLPTAYRWFVKALHQQPSNSRISTDLQVLWNQMTPEEKQVAMQK